jgi:hypothetical protein
VRQLSSRRVMMVAGDAASATPVVVSAMEEAGVSVTSIQTLQPSFDEVFVRLVERANGVPTPEAPAVRGPSEAEPGVQPAVSTAPQPHSTGSGVTAEVG